MNSFLGSNSMFGPNSLRGDSAYQGTSGFSGDSSLSGISSASLKPLSGYLDPQIAAMFGNQLVNRDGQQFYTGRFDPSTLQFGTEGYQTKDFAPGQYQILDAEGNVLGTGYKDLKSSVGELYHNLLSSQVREITPFSPDEFGTPSPQSKFWTFDSAPRTLWRDSEGDPYARFRRFSSREEALRAAQHADIDPDWFRGGPLNQWEVIGQLERGIVPSSSHKAALSSDGISESISGTHTMYGSRPLIHNGKLIGYDLNLGPGSNLNYREGRTHVFGTPTALDISHNGRSNAWDNRLWRTLNNPKGWGELVSGLGDNHVFVTPDNVSKLPGWTNHSNYEFEDKSSGFGGSWLGPILSLAGFAFPAIAPFTNALGAGVSLANGNPLGALTSILGSTGVLGELGSSISNSTGLPVEIGNALVSGGLGGLNSVMHGQNFGRGFLGGATGSLGGQLIGSQLSSMGAPTWASGIGASLGSQLARQLSMGNTINPRALAINAAMGGLNQIARTRNG